MVFVDKEKQLANLDICKSCTHFFQPTRQCSICLCYMPLKTKLKGFECPIWLWTNKTAPESSND